MAKLKTVPLCFYDSHFTVGIADDEPTYQPYDAQRADAVYAPSMRVLSGIGNFLSVPVGTACFFG